MTTERKMVEGAAPPPPPEPVEESRGDHYASHKVFAKSLFDMVLIHGPIGRTQLWIEAGGSIPTQSWREFVRYHPHEDKPSPTRQKLDEAQRFFFDHALAQGLERGWLIEKDGKFSIGTCPPSHTPLSTTGATAELIAQRLTKGDNAKAMRILSRGLRAPTDPSRKAALKSSLAELGQIQPIIRWQPLLHDAVIVDGWTRLELLEKLGYVQAPDGTDRPLIKFLDLSPHLGPVTVLSMRIATEMNKDSKTDEGRAQFVALLAAEGMPQEAIAHLTSTSRRTVARILSTVGMLPIVDTPNTEDVAEFQWLADAGWSVREIAERTGWSKSSVSNYLTAKRTAKPPKATKPLTPRQIGAAAKSIRKPPPTAKRKLSDEQMAEAARLVLDEGLTQSDASVQVTGRPRRNGGVRGVSEAVERERFARERMLEMQNSPPPHCPTCTCGQS